MNTFSKWRIKNVILVCLIAIICGLIYSAFDWIYNLIFYAPLAGTGWAPLSIEAIDGLWFIAGPIALVVTKLPGAGIFAETIGALIETLIGGNFGIGAIIEGLFQGLGAEIGFGIFKYKKVNLKVLALSAILTAVFSFISDLFVESYLKLKIGTLITYFLTRLASSIIFSALLVYLIWKLFKKTNILKN